MQDSKCQKVQKMQSLKAQKVQKMQNCGSQDRRAPGVSFLWAPPQKSRQFVDIPRFRVYSNTNRRRDRRVARIWESGCKV